MSAAFDFADGLAFAQTVSRAKETRAILSAIHLTMQWSGSSETGADLSLWAGQTHFVVPNGGWLKMANFFAGSEGAWEDGDAVVRLFALRDEEEVELATATLTSGATQATQVDLVQLLAGDQLHVEVEWGDFGDDEEENPIEVTGSVVLALGLYR